MPTPTSAVKVNPNTGALIDPVAATFKSANNIINGDRYLTSSTTSLSLGNGTKTLTIGTGLSYSTQQDIIIANDATHHMHATVTSYNSSTGELVADVAQHTGSGTFTSWTVNVGGIAAGVIPTGGTTGQVLNKASGSNYDVQWGPTFTGTGSLDIGSSVVEIQQQLQTIGTFHAGGNIYISDALTTAGDVVFSGAYDATFTLTGNTSVTFPTSGTLLSSAAIGVSVQAYDADLTTWAGITPGAGVAAALAENIYDNGSVLLYNDDAGTPSFIDLSNANSLPLATGVSGVLPETNGGTGKSSMVKFHAYKTADQTTTGGGYEQVTYGSEEYDTANAFASNAFTAPSAGKYIFGVSVYCGTAARILQTALYKNGTQVKRMGGSGGTRSGDIFNGTVTLSLAANDVITVYCYTDGATTLTGAQTISYFWGQLLPGS
jgi:hypothetical protein